MQHNNPPKQIDNAQNIINEFNGVMQRFYADMQIFVQGMDLLAKSIKLDKNDLYQLHRYTSPYRVLTHNPFQLPNTSSGNENTDAQTSRIMQRFASSDFNRSLNAFRRGTQQYGDFFNFVQYLEKKYADQFAALNKINAKDPTKANAAGSPVSKLLTQAAGNPDIPLDFNAESVKLVQTLPRHVLLLDQFYKNATKAHEHAIKAGKTPPLVSQIEHTLNKMRNDTDEVNESIRNRDKAKKYKDKGATDYLSDRKILARDIFNDVLLAIEKTWNQIDKQHNGNKYFRETLIKHMDMLQTNTNTHTLLANKKDREKLIADLQKSLKAIQREQIIPSDKIYKSQLTSLLSNHLNTLKQVNRVLSKDINTSAEKITIPPRPKSMPAPGTGKVAVPPRPKSMPAPSIGKVAVPPRPKSMPAPDTGKVAVPPRPKSMPAPSTGKVAVPPRPKSMPAPSVEKVSAKTNSLFKERQPLIGRHRNQDSKQEAQEPPIPPRSPKP